MPNIIQHSLWPFVWSFALVAALGIATPLVLALCVILSVPMAIYSALPDLRGIWGGSSPGWGLPTPDKGDWAEYSSAHHGPFMERFKANPFYAFHLWQDLYSHGHPDYLILETREKQSFWWDLLNDVLVVGLLWALLGAIFALCLIVGVILALYVFKIVAWKRLGG